MRLPLSLIVLIPTLLARPTIAADPAPLEGVRRVVFLGDSITYSGQYVEFIEAYLRAKNPEFRCEFLDLGLPSETVSGLSEPGHAGGEFPRPTVHERLGRVLEKTKPDLVVACYGMNDGVYYPYSEERFRKFREGIEALREEAKAAGAKVLHLTPPVFDPAPIRAKTLPAGLQEYRRPYEGYDEVLNLYAAWLLARRGDGWDIVDIHGPLKAHLERERLHDAAYRLSDDGVHLNEPGHWLIAHAILKHWGVWSPVLEDASGGHGALSGLPHGAEIFKLVRQEQKITKDAWLSAVGHKRPGMAKGLPLDEAARRAAEIEARIRTLVGPKP